jgi:hypothetical protein
MDAPYPDDADGDALREVAARGADMSKPMTIEYTILAADVDSARSLAERIATCGYAPRLEVDGQDGSVSIYCARRMLATYDGVVSCQAQLNELCLSVSAECDGWITSGNRQNQ